MRPPTRIVLLATTLCLACSNGQLAKPAANPEGSNVLWSADHETGDTSQWYSPSTGPTGNSGGGEFDSGNATVTPSRDVAHGGAWSLKLTISTPSSSEASGARMFRWAESRAHRALWYRVWYYLPQQYSVAMWWNVFQWKSKRAATGAVDPFFILNVGNRQDGSMYLYLFDWQRQISYQQNIKNIPVKQWFEVEAFYECAGDGTGRVIVRQDNVQLFDLSGVETRYADGDCQWSVDNYSASVTPSPTNIYIDDAEILSTTSVPSN